MKKLAFTYDPLFVTRHLLQRYVEKNIQGKFYKAKQFACYEFLRLVTDEELEGIINEYGERNSISVITFDDWEMETRLMFEVIFRRKQYMDLEIMYKKRGHGRTGMGVYDVGGNVFYDCHPVHHWETLQRIISDTYPQYKEPLAMMYMFDSIQEHEGVSRTELEGFIMTNFQLIGENKPLDSYL